MSEISVLDLISSVGFPIAACVTMALYISNMQKNKDNDMKELIKEFKDSVNNLNIMMITLTTRLEEWVKGSGDDDNK